MTDFVFQFSPHSPMDDADYRISSESGVESVERYPTGRELTLTSGSTIKITDTGTLQYSRNYGSFDSLSDLFGKAVSEISSCIETDISNFKSSLLIRNENPIEVYLGATEEIEDFANSRLSCETRYRELSDTTVMISFEETSGVQIA